jgi:hypothetical protein
MNSRLNLPMTAGVLLALASLTVSSNTLLAALPNKVEVDPALEISEPRTYRLKIVIRVDAPDGAARGVIAEGPIPIEWQEQKLRLIEEKLTPGARVTESMLKDQAGMLRLQVREIPKGGFASVERLYEVTRYHVRFTLPPEELAFARRLTLSLRDHLTGNDPGIETKHRAMVDLARSLKKDDAAAWDTVQGFWSWTRDNVKFDRGDYRGALHALEQRCGDCEEMSVLFISLCRIAGIPSRSVWVEGHSYPEFYLADKDGQGHWIPCQVLGPEWFGEMGEYRPIFQKGDGFFDSIQKKHTRYVPHALRSDGSGPDPKLSVEHVIIADSDINGPGYNNPK